MGRFYRTTVANPIDYMYRANVPLMEQVIQANDQYIDQSLSGASDLGTEVDKFDYLPKDEANAKAIKANYDKQVDDITQAILKDPAGWRNQSGNIRSLQKKVVSDFLSGDISKYTQSYGNMKTAFDEADKRAELYNTSGGEKGTDPVKVAAWKQYEMENFKGTKDPTSPSGYNIFNPTPLTNSISLNKILDDTMSKIVHDKNTTEFTQDEGSTWNDVKKTWEGIDPKKLLRVATNRVLGDSNVMRTLKQEGEIGYINGMTYNGDENIRDTKGNLLSNKGSLRLPYNEVKNPLSEDERLAVTKEQARINALKRKDPAKATEDQKTLDEFKTSGDTRTAIQWDNGSYLAAPLQDAIDKYSGTASETSSKLRENPIWMQKFVQGQENYRMSYTQGQENARQQAGFVFQRDMKDVDFANDMAKLQYQASTKANNGKGGLPASVKNISSNSVLSQRQSTPYSNQGKDNIVLNLQEKAKNNNADLANYTSLRDKAKASGDTDMQKFYTDQISNVIADQATLQNRLNTAKGVAVSKVLSSSRDKDLYNNASQIEKDYNNIKPISSIKRDTPSSYQQMLSSPEYQKNEQTRKDYNRLQKLKENISNEYSNQLIAGSKNTTNRSTIVETTNLQDNFIRSSWSSDPSSFQIIDETGALDTKNTGILDPHSENVSIIGAGPSPSGSGMTIYIDIKDPKTGIVSERQVVPVGNTSDIVQERLMGDFAKSKDPSVNQLAVTVTSPFYKSVHSATTDVNQEGKPGELSSEVQKTLNIGNGQSTIGITRLPNMQGYKVEIKGKDGNWNKVPNVYKNKEGKIVVVGDYFPSDADIVQSLETIYPQ